MLYHDTHVFYMASQTKCDTYIGHLTDAYGSYLDDTFGKIWESRCTSDARHGAFLIAN